MRRRLGNVFWVDDEELAMEISKILPTRKQED
jgi:hypothetical protein